MQTSDSCGLAWAEEEFSDCELGDQRRTARLMSVAACAFERPNGKVSAVFGVEREREGAYDLLENPHVSADEIMASVARATARRADDSSFVVVPVDGSSLTLVDRADETDFGYVGPNKIGARGLKVVSALAVDPNDVVIGWLAMTYWARPSSEGLPPRKSHARDARSVDEKETRYWVQTLESAQAMLDEHKLRGWFQIDREGDGADLLRVLTDSTHWWTVRSSHDRTIELAAGDVGRLRTELERQKPEGAYELDVPAVPGRKARKARMVVRIAKVVLRLRDRRNDRITRCEVVAVWTREEGTAPPNEKPLDWLLYTNREVTTLDDALLVVRSYAQRWRIEECHRTWKRGDCNVESTQLRSVDAVHRWAIILGAVAARIERLKRLARVHPQSPASVDLSPLELRTLVLHRSRVDGHRRMGESTPTIADVVAWLAELGGFGGKYSGKPPGATVIARGLHRLSGLAEGVALADSLRATK